MAKRKGKPKGAFDNVYVKAGAVTVGLVVLYGLFNKSKAATMTSKDKPNLTIAEQQKQFKDIQNSYAGPTQKNNVSLNSIGGSALSYGVTGATIGGPVGFVIGAAVGLGAEIYKGKKITDENEAYFANSTFVKRIPDGRNKCGEVVLRGPDGVEFRIDRIDYDKMKDFFSIRTMGNRTFYDDANFGVKSGIPKCTENFPTPIADAEKAADKVNQQRIINACKTVEGKKTLTASELIWCERNALATENLENSNRKNNFITK